MNKPVNHFYEFDQFRIDVTERLLLHEGTPLALPPKAFDILLSLVQQSGHVLERRQLIETIWPDTFIEENNLTQYISALRKALGDDRHGQRYIETVARRGYRFLVPVRQVRDEGPELVVENRTRVRVVVKEEKEEQEEEIVVWAPEAVEPKRGHKAITGGIKSSFLAMSPRRRVVATLVLLIALLSLGYGAAYLAFFRPAKRQPAADAKRTLAVLPFRNLKGDTATEFLSYSLADAIISRLGYFQQLIVRPSSYVGKYRDQEVDPKQVAKELNVQTLLTGSFVKEGDTLRVSAELIDVQNNEVLWRETMDMNYEKLLTVQDHVASNVVQGLRLKLTPEEAARAARTGPQNPQAYEAYLKGRYFWNRRTPEGIEKALEYFKQAVALEPNYAQAYAGIADCYNFLSLDPRVKVAAAMTAIKKALEIDDTLGEAHASLGLVRLFHERNCAEAEKEFKGAIELNPNYATAFHWYAFDLAAMGRLDEALEKIKQAQEVDPLSLIIDADAGQMFYFARNYDRAIEQSQKAVDMDPTFPKAHVRLGEAKVQKRMYEEAIEESQKGISLGEGEAYWLLGYTYAVSGRRDEAIKILGKLKSVANKNDPQAFYWVALIYKGLGDKDQAFAWLEKSYDYGAAEMLLLKVEPMLDELRSDPRFDELLVRMKLAT